MLKSKLEKDPNFRKSQEYEGFKIAVAQVEEELN